MSFQPYAPSLENIAQGKADPGFGLHAGLRELQVLKTTQSGYEGFLHDKYTLLPDVKDRIMATSVTSTWRCGRKRRLLTCKVHACGRLLGITISGMLLCWQVQRIGELTTMRRTKM